VSSLWTPDGEREVHRSTDDPADDPADHSAEPGPGGEPVAPDDVRAIEAELADARRRLAEVPAEVVVVNHAMGLYELAAIHLSDVPPRLADAALAIDAFACLVEGLGERLGSEVDTLRSALSQIRLAFVQIKGASA